MKNIHLQYRNDGFAYLSTNAGSISVSAATWRAKRWAIKMLKREASACGLTLRKKNGMFYAGYENRNAIEYRLFPELSKCWVSPTSRDLRKAFGFRGRNILDKGF